MVLLAVLVAIVLAGSAWAIARLAAGAADANQAVEIAWACSLAILGLVLLGAAGVQWIDFHRKRSGARERAAEAAEKELEDAEEAQQAAAQRKRRSAIRRHRFATLAWILSWLEPSLEKRRHRGRPEVTVSVTAPAPPPSPPPEREPEAPPAEPPKMKPSRFEVTAYGKLAIAPPALLAVVAPWLILDQRWLAFTLAAVALLGLGLWRLAHLSKGDFVWYGLAVALSVPLFGTVALATRNIDDPQAQPVAIIRHGDHGTDALQGLYVTEAKERVYFANVATEGCGKKVVGDSGRLFWIPQSEVAATAAACASTGSSSRSLASGSPSRARRSSRGNGSNSRCPTRPPAAWSKSSAPSSRASRT